jgi:hypothetical protein
MADSKLRLTLLAGTALLLGTAPAAAAGYFERVATMPVFCKRCAGPTCPRPT